MKTKKKYLENGARMAVVSTQMDLLGITDISTPRQEKNGTVVWRLPIKNNWPGNNKPSYIEVASFSTGYVRNQNSGYSNYQLNKGVRMSQNTLKIIKLLGMMMELILKSLLVNTESLKQEVVN